MATEFCGACGTPWHDHLGLTGTCALLQKEAKDNATLRARVAEVEGELAALKAGPTDAAVRDAVRHAECVLAANPLGPHVVMINEPMLRTIIRAVQSPRLTEEQVEAVKDAPQRCRHARCVPR